MTQSALCDAAAENVTAEEVVVQPIIVGFRFGHALRFLDESGLDVAGLSLTNALRVYGQFRRSAKNEGDPYAVVDTQDGTLEVVDDNTISFSISKDRTEKIPPGKAVWVDFAWFDGVSWHPIPVQIGWPVLSPVTVPP